jgi:hypothetical protein
MRWPFVLGAVALASACSGRRLPPGTPPPEYEPPVVPEWSAAPPDAGAEPPAPAPTDPEVTPPPPAPAPAPALDAGVR